MHVSYDYYRIFYYVAKYGTISRAAKELLSNQPNLTRAIHNLEQELGCLLFTRNHSGMHLTAEGEKLYAHVQIACSHIAAGEAEMLESKSLASGSVFIATSEVALHCVLLPVLQRYRMRYPGIQLKISNHSTPQATASIQAGLADFALVTTPTIPSASITEPPLLCFREAAICSAAFPKLADRTVSFAELLQQPLISLGPHTKSYALYADFFAQQGLSFQPEIEAATADQILPMVKADLGVGFLPAPFFRHADGITVIQLQAPLPQRKICILKRKDQSLSRAARELERMILEAAAPSPA